jgi:hyperosmotically inducible periplasmic protein
MNKRNLLFASLVALVVASGCAGSRTQESTGEYVDDTTISTKVKSKLLVDEDASGLAINVETFKGVVQLSGFVKSEEEKQRAEEIAEGVDGVKRVENRISVRGS